jgi:L-2-hydroxyglutarate oxidase
MNLVSLSASSKEFRSRSNDIVVVGGGILGVSIAYWLSKLYDCQIALVEKEGTVARHTSSRNTGMVHRPFYLNPTKKKVFAKASQKSYFLWKELATRYNLPWRQAGTIEVAVQEEQLDELDQYKEWALQNGMEEDEIAILSSKEVKDLEPEVSCPGAIFSKTDTAVDYGEFTNFLFEKATQNGLRFIGDAKVEQIKEKDGESEIQLSMKGSKEVISSKFIINAGGGASIDIAHSLGLGEEYTDLHFRGEYWQVAEPFASKVTRSIYSVAKHKEYPFLDPHFIMRADGTRQIGPNAVLVLGPYAYRGFSEQRFELFSKFFERPISPKLRLFTNGRFLSLVWDEWRSSISKGAMCDRVKQFVPNLDVFYLKEKGIAGVRSSVINEDGFVPEAILLSGANSFHILNYNSPGATGAPAFSAFVLSNLMKDGLLDRLRKKNEKETPASRSTDDLTWKFEDASDL